MDEGALKSFLRIFLVLYSLYVWWCLYVGRVHVPAVGRARNNTIERQTVALIYWMVWLVYFSLWVFAMVKGVPYIFMS